MIKLLIVDDEPLVQIGIKSMINWASLGIEVCGTAVNGEAALSMIEEHSPEIVITDIKMPKMNGLELAKACRDTYGPVPVFIILTSYEEFSLIKQAMSYQAVDYLVKLELDAQSLTDSVNRALERLKAIKASRKEPESASAETISLENYHEKFFLRLLHNLFDSDEQFLLQAKDLKLDFSDSAYLAAQGSLLSTGSAQLDENQQISLYSSSLQMVQDILKKYLSCYVIPLDLRHFAVIFHGEERALSSLALKEAWENVCKMVQNYFNVSVRAGLGSVVHSPAHISISYQEARQSLGMTGDARPIASIVEEDGTDSQLKNSFNISLWRNDLSRAFEEFDTEALHATLTQIIELFGHGPVRLLQAMDGACNILYLALSLLPDGEQIISPLFSSYPDGYRSIYRMATVEQIVEWLTQFRDGLCESLRSRRRTYKESVVNNVQKYINSHVEEHLSLNDVAAVFGLSPNYLSSLFKKTCNVGFSEYITQRKIARAKSLLLESDLKVYEVADRLGFESAFYFSKVFKKVEGVSPRDFVQERTDHTL